MRRLAAIICVLFIVPGLARAGGEPAEKLLYDFETAADLKAWSNLEAPDGKHKEPAARLELSAENATSGQHSLKITFAGGNWPTVTTTAVSDDWLKFKSFEADVTVSRDCVVGFTVLQEKSQRGESWEALISRWSKTAFLKPGKNRIRASLPQPNDYAVAGKWGKIVRFEIFMYQPGDGESIHVDNVRLLATKYESPAKTTFTVAGTDWKLQGNGSADAVIALGKKFKESWTKPEVKTVAQIEEEFRARLTELKKTQPRAVLAVLRDGETGYDPAQPGKAYQGWQDAYFNSHGPDGNYLERAQNRGKNATHEIFMRHRSPLMRVDLASIPSGSEILAAKLVIVRADNKIRDEHDPQKKPTMWVVEPCNRPWSEYEVNAFEYARGKFWKAVGGIHWGEDGDFLPIFLAHGPGQGKVNAWDFTEAVRFWTSGQHANHGFMLHGDSHDYMVGSAREATTLQDRPAVLVIYVPK